MITKQKILFKIIFKYFFSILLTKILTEIHGRKIFIVKIIKFTSLLCSYWKYYYKMEVVWGLWENDEDLQR